MIIEEQFRRLAVVLARAFYDEIPTEGVVDPGAAVVIFDALTRRHWVREDQLAERLKLQFKQLQRTLRFFEAQKLVTREQCATRGEHRPIPKIWFGRRLNSARGKKAYSVALPAITDHNGEETKVSYFCLNYAQMRALVNHRLKWMEEQSTDGLLEKMKVQLKPLRDQLSVVNNLEAPNYVALGDWKLNRGKIVDPDIIKLRECFGFGIDSSSRARCGSRAEEVLAAVDLRIQQRPAKRPNSTRLFPDEDDSAYEILLPWLRKERREHKPKMEENMSLQDELKPSLPSTSRTPHQPECEGDTECEEETSIPNLESEIKKVIDLLRGTGMLLTAEEIKDKCGVDVQGNRDLFKGLSNYPSVTYVLGFFQYKSMHRARNMKGLVQALRRSPDGIPVAELKDEYPAAMEDLQVLKTLGYIYLLRNTDVDLDMAYARYDPRAPLAGVDDELKKLFWSAEEMG